MRPGLALALMCACGGSGGDAPDGGADAAPPAIDFGHDIASTALAVDVNTRAATAAITLASPPASGWASFEIGDLVIATISGPEGPLPYRLGDGRVDVAIADPGAEITFAYTYRAHEQFDGASAGGLTFLWPYFCGNLFPCKSDPADGITFTLAVDGVPDGSIAVHPDAVATEAPSYMPAWAIGDYTRVDLGATTAGTEIAVWHLPGGETAAAGGTEHLVAVFDWLEQTYGAYRFGGTVGSVAAAWGPGAYGGMEHHPLWHVGQASLADAETHAHEAAHGWFGDGIRIACWEDFVLSEGTVSYLAARALEATAGATISDAVWASYTQRLGGLSGTEPTWPEGCGAIDIIDDGLFSTAPYMRGAFFWRAVEERVGRAELDAALASFYAEHAGGAATMQQALDWLAGETGYDPDACAQSWLRDSTIPAPGPCP